MTTHAQSTFEIAGWEQTTYLEAGDAPEHAQAIVKKTFEGHVQGASTARLLLTGSDDGRGYVALERFEGRVGERTGTFDMQHGGVLDRGDIVIHQFGVIIPGTGTNELRGLRGEVRFQHDETGAFFMIDYAFDDAG